MQKLKGLIAAPFTAFDADGELNLPAIDKQIELLTGNQISGALVNGTTGECGSLTLDERMTVAERWCAAARAFDDFAVVAHVGHSCLKDSRTLAAHAQKVGATAVAALPPYYFKPASAEILVEHCRLIAEAAPGLPFYYYHIPSISGVAIPVINILRALGDKIPNFAGVKFTYEDLYDFGLCLEFENRRYDILCGRDESLLPGLALGATGAVGSTYNYIAPVYRELIEAFAANDLAAAQAAQEKSRQIISVMVNFGGIPAAKTIMRMIGIDCGQVRLPLAAVSDAKFAEFEKALAAVGFFDVCSRSTNASAPNAV
ncbi:MAG TPA: dihydrodipicolinate synthase family protein [Pyrinomonadaceae bacterium]|jgi:N-acetylneuraminate lyase